MFNVWNSYEGRLPAAFYVSQLLATGDLLYKKGFFHLASVHCYGRYLSFIGHQEKQNLVENLQEKGTDNIAATVRILLHLFTFTLLVLFLPPTYIAASHHW